ncbi:MAG TPA: Xaa-Pro peptidase family protein [Acidimicrobiales bacterium]|nr:Xaa-Pro peptidase family protein [Acidimicrobiales bacterium]
MSERAVAARSERLARVREEMARQGVGALLLSLGADLPWLCGYEAMPLERPTVLVVPVESEATLVVPEIEAPRVVPDAANFALRPWAEGEDPIEVIASLTGRHRVLAISDRAWASLLLSLVDALPNALFRKASTVTAALRAVKDEEEIAALRAASAAADRVAEALLAGEIPLIGATEAQVSRELSARLLAEGHEKVNFAIVGSGPNSASPHHEPGARRIAAGDAVVCDFGGTLRLGEGPGYCSDTTRTVVAGEPPPGFAELYAVLERAQSEAVAAVAAGRRCEEIDAAARTVIEEAGFGEAFLHRTGHGIGIEEHEDPYIVSGNATTLRPGHAFSVEPGIYLAGRMGARIEDIVVVTEAAPEVLNHAPHGLVVVG